MNRIEVFKGNITSVAADAIVNAANQSMLGGGGVDGAIHRAAGPDLLEACRQVPLVGPRLRCPTGEARITPGFKLAAKYVIHTVGPIWSGGQSGEPELLANCYRNSLLLAGQHDVRSIAFPAISCGAFGYPVAKACAVAVAAIRDTLQSHPDFEKILFVAFDEHLAEAFARAMTSSHLHN
jgi:O-acetyl-ADP-ribose deacetylase (regulator of RNase III)